MFNNKSQQTSGTIDIILRKVYDKNKIVTNIPSSTLKEFLYLCTKHVHFKFNGEIYIQCDGAVMGSPLGPLFANSFMISLEENILPKLKSYLRNWRRYIDDIFASVLSEKIDLIIHELNSYHSNIKFRYELEIDNKLVFLDVCVTRINRNEIEVSVYRKGTNTSIYINCTLMLHQTEKSIKNCRNHIIDQELSQSYYIIDQELLQSLEVEAVKTTTQNRRYNYWSRILGNKDINYYQR